MTLSHVADTRAERTTDPPPSQRKPKTMRLHQAELVALEADDDGGDYRLESEKRLGILLAGALAPVASDEIVVLGLRGLADELHVLTRYVMTEDAGTDRKIFESAAESIERRLRVLATVLSRVDDALRAERGGK